jgi:outer membrane protein assembly factor BamB
VRKELSVSFLFAVLLLVLLSPMGVRGADRWPMFHHDLSHTGYTTSTAPNINNIIWSYTTGGGVGSSPVVADGRVYVGSYDNKVYCLHAADGDKVWEFPTGGRVFSSPAVANGKVYVGSDDNKVYCLHASTGGHIWNYTTGGFVFSSPAVANGKVYVGSDDNKVYCLGAADGDKVWEFPTGLDVWSSPVVADGRVYVGSVNDKVYCLGAADGDKVWEFPTGHTVGSSPAVDRSYVYVGSGNKVYCLRAWDGALVWSFATGGDVFSSPAVANGKVYVGSEDDNVYCLRAWDGALVWSFATGGDVLSSPAVADGRVYIGSYDNNIYAFGPPRAPRTGDLVINFRSDVQAAYADLKAGVCDLVGYEIQKLQYEDAIEDPNIVLAPVVDFGMYEVDINNNWTVPSASGYRSPTSYREFRQAAAFLIDKEVVIDTFCAGYAVQIDQPVVDPAEGWMNDSMRGVNYPYIYNPASAAATLDAGGFVEGTTANPHYDSGFPGSTEYLRVYPAGHEKAGADVDPIIVYCRSDDSRRLETGRMLYRGLRKLGIPCDVHEVPSAVSYDPVMGDFDYHFYTGGWSLGRFPTYVYGLYHDQWYFAYGANYVTGKNSTGDPMYPRFNELSEDLYYALTFGDAIAACKAAVGYFTEECITIPLWSSLAFWAYSSKLLGVVNMVGAGLENGYSFMNAYKSDGSAIRESIIAAPTAMNVLYSSWYYDRQVLDRINLYGGIDYPPYDIVRDQAGFIQDWSINEDCWFDEEDGLNKSKVTYWLRKDAYFVEPVTGVQGGNVNATSWLMSAFIQYALDDCWLSSAYYPDVHHFVVLDDYCVEVYYDDLSYWFTYDCDGAMLPPRVWLQPSGPLSSYETETVTMDCPCTVPLTGEIAWIEEVSYAGAPLEMFTDYNWIKGELVISSTKTGGDVQVKYWKLGDAHGYWPGGRDFWTNPEIIEGAGMYYLVDYTPSIGGSATLKKNPYFWLETPPLGEVDWYWSWLPRDETRPAPDQPNGPRQGCFAVDLDDYDLIYYAFDSQAYALPDEYWFPGADLFPAGGRIDLYDCFAWARSSGQTFGHTPPHMEHDVAVTGIATSKTIVGQGYSAYVNVSMYNQGGFTENFSLTLYADTSVIETLTDVSLASGESALVTFAWDTTDFSKGSYTVNASASPVQYELDIFDNNCTDGSVIVTFPGDVDGDFDVDIYDVVEMCSCYGCEEGDPEYEVNCDIDCDGDIDIYDIVLMCGNYGEIY